MITRTLVLLISVGTMSVGTLTGCAPANNNDDNDAAELQRSIEQLENEIGRLEFRIFQLESVVLDNAVPDNNEATTAAPAPDDPRSPAVSPDRQDRYDLTPVE